MRSVPTWYTGNRVPSEQILGGQQAPQEFHGRWNDRYNFKGYAQDTFREFVAMAFRGNLVEISFQGKGYLGLIKTWSFNERRDWDIRYRFTVSIHNALDDDEDQGLGAEIIRKSPISYQEEADATVALILNDADLAPVSHLGSGPADEMAILSGELESIMDSLGDTLDQRDLNVSAPNNTISSFSLLSSKFRAVTDKALEMNEALLDLKSDAHLAIVTGKSLLDFEDWGRSLRFHARVLMGQSMEAERDLKGRDEPEVDRLYRAREGESLMAISRQVYGSPHQWGVIYEANGLTSEVLTGDEILIIPQLGEA